MRWSFFLLALIAGPVPAQQRILHFTRTSGFDHGTREVSFALFTSIAQDLGVVVDDDATGDAFTDATSLAEYDAIIFSNTSGAGILDLQQRSNFEDWVTAGGKVMGLHAATDTYRHSTANGGNTGAWDFYAELIGASVQEGPNHVSGTPQYAMSHIGTHASTANLPDPWSKNEEYYYWEGGYYGGDNTEVLRVEETIGPNGQVNSYDAPRPMSWYRELPNASRVFYTALGHATSNYTSDALFRTHVKDALSWLLDFGVGVNEQPDQRLTLMVDAAQERVVIHGTEPGQVVQVIDAMGRTNLVTRADGTTTALPYSALPNAIQLIRIGATAVRVVIPR